MDAIIAYKTDGTLPSDHCLAAKLQKMSSWFEIWNDVLYKKSYSRPLLRCVTPEKGKEILADLHQGLCSSHIGGRALAEKALRTVDYFTKWVEAEALKNIKTYDVKAFIWRNVITRFGVPQSIVFDNGPQFETPKLKEWLTEHGIHSCFASVGRPQANGQVEAFNKIISQGIKKKFNKAKGLWADELPNVLWSIRTTTKNSTG
ncbi:uncharacterized protein [Spinacia oleracea]|uniref:Integrase catalytic domain-containing protein n=1 Tax=Spinacia oleracea TaxID=3562 RepID=A0ABM3RQD0_SPIOL|nr:uncharacterized protein LOC130471617 [Spinacia oleracea]